jgi:hypothetical protein
VGCDELEKWRSYDYLAKTSEEEPKLEGIKLVQSIEVGASLERLRDPLIETFDWTYPFVWRKEMVETLPVQELLVEEHLVREVEQVTRGAEQGVRVEGQLARMTLQEEMVLVEGKM